jgi:putative endonuclease
MSGFVYILRSTKNDRYYIGSTNDPERRLSQHRTGFVAATRNKGPWERVALIEFPSPTIAKKAEYHLKRQKTVGQQNRPYPEPIRGLHLTDRASR